MFVKNISRVRGGVQHRCVRKKHRAPDGPKLRARRKKQFKSLLNGFESAVVEEEYQRLRAMGRENLALFLKFLLIPDTVLFNRDQVDALSVKYGLDCVKTVTQFLDFVPAPLPGSPRALARTLVPYAFRFVGLTKAGTGIRSTDSVRRRAGHSGRAVSEGHLRNQLCHLSLYFRYLYALQGIKWDSSCLSERFTLAVKLRKRVAKKAFHTADKTLRRAQRCAAITSSVYFRLVRRQRSDWKAGLALFRAAVQEHPCADHSVRAHSLQSTLIVGLFLRMPTTRPNQVGSYVFVMCLVCP
jgi:hypothetical protein